MSLDSWLYHPYAVDIDPNEEIEAMHQEDPGFEPRTMQQEFDIVVKGLASQDWQQSATGEGTSSICRYRGAGGRKCAIGHLIDDDAAALFDPNNKTVGIMSNAEMLSAGLDPDRRDFYQDMQQAHDCAEYAMRKAFLRIAEEYNLEWHE